MEKISGPGEKCMHIQDGNNFCPSIDFLSQERNACISRTEIISVPAMSKNLS
jgi:hypothetical protein